ncbi:MAG: ATP-binding cassette domain-containing protein [Bdellovibrionales bacterium]|nr:ATP-binding cassette domain-containing protein [Bdellovibrionales bacterium]
MIEVKNLTKAYNTRKAVNDISFSVKRGEILGFLGPNGAGKSTTMKILSGFIPPTSGTAIVNGFDVVKDELNVKASIGYLPETPPVYTQMEVEDYLLFAARLHRVAKPKVKAAVAEAMEKTGIMDVRHRIIGNLSKGYRQRVGLAQAIVHKPPVLILDEPTVGLDPRQIIEIRHLIKSLGGEQTVILSTHILPEVQATCHRVVVIDHGRVVAEDTLDGIAARMQSSSRITLALRHDPAPVLSQIRGLAGVAGATHRIDTNGEHELSVESMKGHDVRPQVAEICVRLGLLGLHQEKLSLEDAFVRLITSDETTLELKQ